MDEPIQPYSDSLHSYTWKEDDDTIHLRHVRYSFHITHVYMYIPCEKIFRMVP